MMQINKIKEFREHLGYTQAAFAEQLGIARSTLCRIEEGRHKPSLGTIMGLKKMVNQHSGGRKILLDEILEGFLSDNVISDDVK